MIAMLTVALVLCSTPVWGVGTAEDPDEKPRLLLLEAKMHETEETTTITFGVAFDFDPSPASLYLLSVKSTGTYTVVDKAEEANLFADARAGVLYTAKARVTTEKGSTPFSRTLSYIVARGAQEIGAATRELLARIRELDDGGQQETVTMPIEGSDLVLVVQVQGH